MADLYVSTNGSDSNDGSQNAPFRSILAASQVAQPGDIVHVAPGTYTGGFTTSASGTSSAHITYVSDTPYGAKIEGGSSSNGMGWWNSGNYVDIKGFDVDGSGSDWRIGLYGSGSHTTFQGNEVHDILTNNATFASASASGNGGAGIEMDSYSGAVDGSILGNLVYNIGPSGQTSSLVHGIYQSETGNVENNIVYNVVGVGITTWHGAHNINIINNTIDGARDGGIYVGSGDSGATSSTGDYIAVENNIITNSKNAFYEGGITGTHNTYVDNLIYNDGSTPISLQHGLTASGTVTADPEYVDATNHDYHLKTSSPAIGAGTGTDAPAVDFDGNARPQGKGYDIGAYQDPPTSSSAPTSDPAPTPTPAPTSDPAPTPTPTPTITLADTTATVNQSNVTITGTGSHLLFIYGSSDSVDLSGGRERIYDNGSQNSLVLPAIGNGHDYIYGNVFNNGDVFDLHSLLASTNWDGVAADLSSILKMGTSGSGSNAVLYARTSSSGAFHQVATFEGSGAVSLNDFLQHATQ